jgi:hypothetical protein
VQSHLSRPDRRGSCTYETAAPHAEFHPFPRRLVAAVVSRSPAEIGTNSLQMEVQALHRPLHAAHGPRLFPMQLHQKSKKLYTQGLDASCTSLITEIMKKRETGDLQSVFTHKTVVEEITRTRSTEEALRCCLQGQWLFSLRRGPALQ